MILLIKIGTYLEDDDTSRALFTKREKELLEEIKK
jgi:hypothetical protein